MHFDALDALDALLHWRAIMTPTWGTVEGLQTIDAAGVQGDLRRLYASGRLRVAVRNEPGTARPMLHTRIVATAGGMGLQVVFVADFDAMLVAEAIEEALRDGVQDDGG